MPIEKDALRKGLKHAASRTQETIVAALSGASGPVTDAMKYATEGGKALRAFLVLEGARLHEIEEGLALPAAAAAECIHAYSLVHDDMPAMDNDDMRRGQPTVHRKWDEGTALLVGDALQSLAFDLVTHGSGIPAERRLALSALLARAAGIYGMVGGQELDIAAGHSTTTRTLEDITNLQRRKTGALIEWAATAGPRLAGADTGPLQQYGRAVGLAFQIADDILDETGDEAKTGKRLKKDAEAGKATFVSLLGLDGARERARALVADAIDALCIYDARADSLRDAAHFVISREH